MFDYSWDHLYTWVLSNCNITSFNQIDEISILMNVPQDPKFHPEGNVFEHTLQTVDEMRMICDRNDYGYSDRLVLILAALCHDLGKPDTTVFDKEKQKYTSYNHPYVGVGISKKFLERFNTPQFIIDAVLPLVENHMCYLSCSTKKAVRKLSHRLFPATIEQLLCLIEADSLGRKSGDPNVDSKIFVPENCKPSGFIASEAMRSKCLKGYPTPLIHQNCVYKLFACNNLTVDKGKVVHIVNQIHNLFLAGKLDSKEEALKFIKEKFIPHRKEN